ncbi:MAG: hypothetical protein CBC22_04280 [Alphaproteobacteria bacterium TMED62]|nr:MAG: hypothetical protein CBC22_04280 [Alphaproteobacteria bacterium TMED62]
MRKIQLKMKRKDKINLYFFLFSIFILVLLIFPIYNIGNRVEPFIFGIPFSLFWIIACILIQFTGILFFLFIDKEES